MLCRGRFLHIPSFKCLPPLAVCTCLSFLMFQEFVQAEVDREAAAVAEERERRRRADDRSAGVDDKLKRLKEQLLTLQEGMAQVGREGGGRWS